MRENAIVEMRARIGRLPNQKIQQIPPLRSYMPCGVSPSQLLVSVREFKGGSLMRLRLCFKVCDFGRHGVGGRKRHKRDRSEIRTGHTSFQVRVEFLRIPGKNRQNKVFWRSGSIIRTKHPRVRGTLVRVTFCLSANARFRPRLRLLSLRDLW